MLPLCWMLYPDRGYLHPSLPLCPPPSLHPAEDASFVCHPNGLGIAGAPREDGISWSIRAQGRAPMQLSLLRRGRSSCDYTGSPPVPPQPVRLRQQELLWVSAALLGEQIKERGEAEGRKIGCNASRLGRPRVGKTLLQSQRPAFARSRRMRMGTGRASHHARL